MSRGSESDVIGGRDTDRHRVEARNERAGEEESSRFDFVVEGDDDPPAGSTSLSLLAGVLGTAGCTHAAAIGLDLVVVRGSEQPSETNQRRALG